MSHREQEREEEGKGEQEGKRDFTTQTMSASSVDMKETFSLPERELEPGQNCIASSLCRKLIAVTFKDKKGNSERTFGLFSYSPSSTKTDDFDFKLLQVFENCEIPVYELYFTPCSRYLLGSGKSSDVADFLVLDFHKVPSFSLENVHEEEEEGEGEETKQRQATKYELKPVKLDLGNDQNFKYIVRTSMNRNFSHVAFSVGADHVRKGSALGIVVLDAKTFEHVAYIDLVTPEMRKAGKITHFCDTICFSPHDENLLAFGFGSKCKAVDTTRTKTRPTQPDEGDEEGNEEEEDVVASFDVEEYESYSSCVVAWPREDKLFFGSKQFFYIADVARNCILQKTALPSEMKDCIFSKCFSHPFRSSSIIIFDASDVENRNFNTFFLDVGAAGGDGESQKQETARIVHQISMGHVKGEKEPKAGEEGKYLYSYYYCFLSPSCLLCTGTMYHSIQSYGNVPGLVCFKGVREFSWPERRKIWLVREKGNENNVPIVRVLREIYFVCQLVCLFA